MADVRLALTVEDLKNVKRDNQSAKAILSQKVALHRVDNGLQGVQNIVENGSSSLVKTNRRHGEILLEMTSQVADFENKYRASKRLNGLEKLGRAPGMALGKRNENLENLALRRKIEELENEKVRIMKDHKDLKTTLWSEKNELREANTKLQEKLVNLRWHIRVRP